MSRKYMLLASITTTSLVLDQATKVWIRDNLPQGARPIEVIPDFFNIVHAENPGAAWGLLRDAEWRIPFFVVTTLIAVGVILYYYYKLNERDLLQSVGLSLILGGALGNFVDRVRYQSVTDFMEMYIGVDPAKAFLIDVFGSYKWPAWNVADACIVVGIGLILYFIFFIEPKLVAAAEAAEAAADAAGPGGS